MPFGSCLRWLGAKVLEGRNMKATDDVHGKAIDADFKVVEEDEK